MAPVMPTVMPGGVSDKRPKTKRQEAVWRVTVLDCRGYRVWTLLGTLADVMRQNDRSELVANQPIKIVSIVRESKA